MTYPLKLNDDCLNIICNNLLQDTDISYLNNEFDELYNVYNFMIMVKNKDIDDINLLIGEYVIYYKSLCHLNILMEKFKMQCLYYSYKDRCIKVNKQIEKGMIQENVKTLEKTIKDYTKILKDIINEIKKSLNKKLITRLYMHNDKLKNKYHHIKEDYKHHYYYYGSILPDELKKYTKPN